MAIRIAASDLRVGDVFSFGGRRAHVHGIRWDGALVVVGIEELGAWLTFDGGHAVVLLARPNVENAVRAAQRRLRTRETRLDALQNHLGNLAVAA